MKPYFFRIGDIQYNLLEVTKLQKQYDQYYHYIKDLSLEDRLVLELCHDNQSMIAVIVADRIKYPFSTKVGQYECMVVEKETDLSETKIADEMAIQHARHYLENCAL